MVLHNRLLRRLWIRLVFTRCACACDCYAGAVRFLYTYPTCPYCSMEH
jgi:hypothetical protein